MRLAHISDLHALDLSGATALDFVGKRALGLLNYRAFRQDKHPLARFEALVDDLNRTKPDHVLATGDISNLSLMSEFFAARRILSRLTLTPRNVTVIPGNHDRYVLASVFDRAFERVMSPYCASDEASSEYPFVRRRGQVAIIGCSTAWPCPPPLADGWLGAAQLARLATLLDETRDHFRVVALHHPPIKNRHAFLRGLRDRDAFQRVIKAHGAELIVHGHEHRDLRNTLPGRDGDVPVIGVGSSTYASPLPDRSARYNVYEIENKQLVSITQHVFSDDANAFVAIAA